MTARLFTSMLGGVTRGQMETAPRFINKKQ